MVLIVWCSVAMLPRVVPGQTDPTPAFRKDAIDVAAFDNAIVVLIDGFVGSRASARLDEQLRA